MTNLDDSGTHATLMDSETTSDHQELTLGSNQELPRGSNLGRYVIIEPIGSGGMGAVYRAYDPQLNRGIALKILSVKYADLQESQRAKARLIREAQALAQLSHPNVVAVYDAGEYEDDVFIAMELIEGKTLNSWMRDEKRSVKEILKVMTAAGKGLSAAHKAGLIHRDFKPGNVIVGDDGRVRVLDFGLARVADQEEEMEDGPTVSEQNGQSRENINPFDFDEISSDSSPNLLQSPLTKAGGVMGTPLYMAPEQHLGLKTDDRTDQFGFCVVLYEALYGKRPFFAGSMEKLKKKVIQQQVSVPSPGKDVPFWLWTIISKGLSARPEDRYRTMESLLEDLGRDPEEEHRQKRLARRRTLTVFALVLLTITLPIGVWYGLRYRTVHLCKSAGGAFDGVWNDATKATVETAFLGTKKSFAQGTWERVERTIDRYLTEWFRMRNDVCEARLLHATQSEELFDLRMGCLQKRIGELGALVKVFVKADAGVVQKAIQASSSLTGIAMCADEEALRASYPPPKTEEEKNRVTAIREKLAEVEALEKTGKYREGLELAKDLDEQAKGVDYPPVRAEARYDLGKLLEKVGKYERAETALYETMKVAGDCGYSLLVAKAMLDLVFVVGNRQARHEEGLSYGRSAEAILAIAGKDDVLRSRLYKNVGVVYKNKSDYDKALSYYSNALSIQTQVLGADHPDVSRTLNNLGVVYSHMGKYDKALEYWNKSLAILEKKLGKEHPIVAMALNNIGGAYYLKAENKKALSYYLKALEIRQNTLGSEHPDIAMSLSNIGEMFRLDREYEKAYQYHLKALAIWEKAMGPQHPLVAKSLFYIGSVLYNLGRDDEGLQYGKKSLAIREKVFGPEHPSLAEPLRAISRVYAKKGMLNKALKILERLVKLCETKICHAEDHGAGLFDLARVMAEIGGNKKRAIKLAIQARGIFGKVPKRFKEELENLAIWLHERGVK